MFAYVHDQIEGKNLGVMCFFYHTIRVLPALAGVHGRDTCNDDSYTR